MLSRGREATFVAQPGPRPLERQRRGAPCGSVPRLEIGLARGGREARVRILPSSFSELRPVTGAFCEFTCVIFNEK